MTAAVRQHRVAPRPMRARQDGLVEGDDPVILPFMAARLQGDCVPDGRLDLSLWGAGRLGTLRFAGWSGPYVYGPNRVVVDDAGIDVAQSESVLVLKGTRLLGLTAARRSAWWDKTGGAPEQLREGGLRGFALPWGVVLAETRGADVVVAVGSTHSEARRGLAMSVAAIGAEASDYVARCDRMPDADPIMRSMVIQGVHAMLSSIRRDAEGRFAGLAAGQAYSAPARTYYRDGHWTLQGLLALAPESVRDQIDLLAAGMQPDGEAPSGVILTGPAQSAAWEQVRRNDSVVKEEHLRPGDWWSDHFDSPLFFVLTLHDYVRATGDLEPARRHWTRVRTVIDRYRGFTANGDALPLKPRHDRDWADNVYRHGYVAYDLGLWVGALDAAVDLGGRGLDPDLATEAAALAETARTSLDQALLQPSGWYADYGTPADFIEDHLTLDGLTLLRYDAVGQERARTVLDAVRRLLETRNNRAQPHGDWGVMCAYPPFKRRGDTRAKSAFAFRYHNGSDWPYLDGIYAEELLRRGLPGWRYPLTRWWRTCLEKGWMGAVEYFAPPFGRGSLLQGWSGLPAAVALKYGSELARAGFGADEDASR